MSKEIYQGLRGPATDNKELIERGKAVPELLADFDRLRAEKSELEKIVSFTRRTLEDAGFENLPQALKELEITKGAYKGATSDVADLIQHIKHLESEVESLQEQVAYRVQTEVAEAEARADAAEAERDRLRETNIEWRDMTIDLRADNDRLAAVVEGLREAIGLATTAVPSMEMDADNPLGMMQRVVDEVEWHRVNYRTEDGNTGSIAALLAERDRLAAVMEGVRGEALE